MTAGKGTDMKDRTEKLREYAQLLIRMGLNIQKLSLIHI